MAPETDGDVQDEWLDLNTLPDVRTPRPDLFTYEQTRRGNAFHEAGHALVGMTYGMSLGRVRLIETPVEDPRPGIAMTGATSWNPTWVGEFDYAVQAAAGSAAERKHFTEAGLVTSQNASTFEAPHDRIMATAVLAHSGYEVVLSGPPPRRGFVWQEIVGRADEMVDRLWPQITVVAHALAEAPDSMLWPDDIYSLTGISNSLPSPGRPKSF